MKFTNTLRLEFEHVYPEEKQIEVIEYLKLVTKETLLSIIGFANTYPQPNFDNFASNLDIRRDTINRVIHYCHKNNIKGKPQLVSRESSLKLAEIIFSNKEVLIDDNNNPKNIDSDEINLFKSFLVINKEVNSKQKLTTSENEENRESLAQMMIAMSFSTSDLGVFKDSTFEFGKLVYCAIERFEILIEFLNSDSDYQYLTDDVCSYFKVKSIDKLRKHVKYLFSQLLILKTKNSYKFNVDDDDESKLFLDTLISNEIDIDDDFTVLKNYPLYKIDDEIYSVIDHFFVVDKFYKSVRFILKESFNKNHGLSNKDRTFFEFFNTKFSEEFLMKTILDKVFNRPHYFKKYQNINKPYEPDYYLRDGKTIFIFENKDVLIRKDIKSSGDIDKILNIFKDKFFENNGKPIGIGQLINSILQIVENNFDYDNYVNTKKNFTIYPILLVNDRILEIPGVNYILNQWYLKSVKEKLKEKYNHNFTKNLTIIDIDTIVFGSNYFTKTNNNFKNFIENHQKEMSIVLKPDGRTLEEVEESINRNLMKQFSPISFRFPIDEFSQSLFIEKFKEIITEDNEVEST
ncbi:hypothetical protein SGQ83_19835 [Flavobacterium sp. Fl-318]|uniref:Restriction endonuclease n=1 Tax=Flavobacterium cupriresistens TaxID=2893885 RepID=A0ABU4RGA8_9FLAO|nr:MULTISPECIES: hypothetical protein [unclassified Flavobacterium]MDX6191615.1 hypothetical protein [Flavobacterium sp. Fl-318]UFH41562.1 hypothetical protein LNP23_17300 [Flavobacterium sp. F-323]